MTGARGTLHQNVRICVARVLRQGLGQYSKRRKEDIKVHKEDILIQLIHFYIIYFVEITVYMSL